MKQTKGDFNCVGVAAALATGTTVEEVEAFLGKTPAELGGFRDLDFYRYLLHKGYVVGMGFTIDPDFPLHSHETLSLECPVWGQPAYAIVQNTSGTHAIYWDGEKIHDPDPDMPNGALLSFYRILSWYPIFKLPKEEK